MPRMSIYAHPHLRQSESYFGYAYTFNEISRYLRTATINRQPLQVDLNSPKSKIQLHYGTPPGSFYSHQYKIQMTQWESSLVPPSWVEIARGYDEYWTANEFGKQAFIDAGVDERKMHVFEHGIDRSVWTPKKRVRGDVLRFLHIDSGSPRKRADVALSAFKAAFGNNLDYEITFKYSHHPQSDADWFDPSVLSSRGEWETGNVRRIYENLTLEHLVSLYHFHDVLIYPSEGEGFGLIPMQALATGMPVISTSRWCSYEQYLCGNVIESTMGQSPIQETYERFGDVVLPSLDSTIDLVRFVADNFDAQSNIFMNQVGWITEKYDWIRLCQGAVTSLHSRLGDEMFLPYVGYMG